jgi:uncharacterized protein (DUF3820 family)
MREYEDKPIPFGKYKDILICDVPNWYLEYIIGEKWFKEKFVDLLILIEKELKYRKQFDIIIKD